MTDLIGAGSRLADVLAAENAALAALDLPHAVALLADKRSAIDGFVAAQAAPGAAAPHDAAERLARRLQSLAEENKVLLTRAMAAQGRVLGIIARAMEPAGYGASRRCSRTTRPTAFALLARA